MQGSRMVAVAFSIGFSVFAAPFTAAAENIEVVPSDIDFGAVELGESLTLPLTLRSLGPTPLAILSVTLDDDGDGAFALGEFTPVAALEAGDSIDVDVTFTPTEVGQYLGAINVRSNDRDTLNVPVQLTGEGASPSGEPTARELMDDLLEVVDAAVADGSLEGKGRCRHARRAHLRIFLRTLQRVSAALDRDRLSNACHLLRGADRRSDGGPNDAVQGPALEEVNGLINDVRAALDCCP